ncbi:MAG: hypothetical protein H6Q59_2918 [Firmicutes bacterium]|nr:hypothetical protein [Bacillota bacterium]
MLRIYICPNCYNFRMVSRKPDAICFHCGTVLESCDVNYDTYMNMSEADRSELKNKYKIRMSQANEIIKDC